MRARRNADRYIQRPSGVYGAAAVHERAPRRPLHFGIEHSRGFRVCVGVQSGLFLTIITLVGRRVDDDDVRAVPGHGERGWCGTNV
jgi:hypothetical protein